MSNEPVAPTAVKPSSEYRTRLWMGAVMALAVAGILVLDHYLVDWLRQPIYPCLLVTVLLLCVLSIRELHALLAASPRPPLWLCLVGGCAMILAGWPADFRWFADSPWPSLTYVFAAVVLAGFLREMAVFREPGGVVVRMALLVWIVAYLGLLPAFFAQLRWLPHHGDLGGIAALALGIFVPKGCDIGAYFTGRYLGRHKMSPVLSPKKTYEGLAGGLVLAALIAVGVNHLVAPLFSGPVTAAAFGVVVGFVGVLGDLAESLIKRDCQKKDASHVVPGFGGVLDVVDSVLFAAPVAYWWLKG